jgi:protein-disulfide isomerase
MSKAARQRTARERLAEERKRQAQRDRQRRALLISLSGLAVVALAVVIGVYAATKKEQRSQVAAAYKGPLAPVTRDQDQSIVMAKAGVTAPVLEVFEDFQCPVCKDMEVTTGETIKKLAAEGKVKVVFRPFHLFGTAPEPRKSNSRRATNASLCVPADKWVSYHDALFKFQPSESEEGFKTEDLVAWGKDVGVTDPGFETCVTEEQKKQQIADGVKYAESRGVDGTPTVFLDGKKLDNQVVFVPETLEGAVAAAAKAGTATPAATPSATPSASPSPTGEAG